MGATTWVKNYKRNLLEILNKLADTLPNVSVGLRILLNILFTVASGERNSFERSTIKFLLGKFLIEKGL